MVGIRALSWVIGLLLVLAMNSPSQLAGVPATSAAGLPATITVSPKTTYQTIEGWEAVAQACQFDCSSFSSYSGALFDQATSDLGINRVRVEIKTTTATSTTFDLNRFDQTMNLVTVPLRQRLAAHGENLWVDVVFVGASGFPAQPDQSAYAQQVLATYQHTRKTYGFVPDSWEILLEPGVVTKNWTSGMIADAVRRSDALLKPNGFTPYFIIPSSPCGAVTALGDFSNILSANGGTLPPDVKEFSYHRYCAPSATDLRNVAALRSQYRINTAMLEHGGATFNELFADLTTANISAWEQYTLAYVPGPNYPGYQYYNIASPSSTSFSLDWRAKWLRHVFHYVRAGAVRVDASSNSPSVAPVAFVNKDGHPVVVVWTTATGSASFSIQGLPAGTYGAVYTTGDTSSNNITAENVSLPDVTITSGQSLSETLPDRGVMSIYGKSGGVSPTPTPTSTSTPGPTPTSSPFEKTLSPIEK
ncbi:MAG TPA: glycoside hydrolase family 30 beta sandwich domain-containing protein [Chloroflexota bacterium]|nr:glycoside hydrolase family 30 beta sandwich domain-containing protein [Chloroflexota bacterium]